MINIRVRRLVMPLIMKTTEGTVNKIHDIVLADHRVKVSVIVDIVNKIRNRVIIIAIDYVDN